MLVFQRRFSPGADVVEQQIPLGKPGSDSAKRESQDKTDNRVSEAEKDAGSSSLPSQACLNHANYWTFSFTGYKDLEAAQAPALRPDGPIWGYRVKDLGIFLFWYELSSGRRGESSLGSFEPNLIPSSWEHRPVVSISLDADALDNVREILDDWDVI